MNKKTNHFIFKIILVFFMVHLSCHDQLLALDPDKPVNQYLVDHWTMVHGLPSTSVHFIEQTPDGYLWIATLKGLVRFDGMTFSTITYSIKPGIEDKKKHHTGSLFVDKKGDLWIGGIGHLAKYHYKTGGFTIFTKENGLTDGSIVSINKDARGNIWVGTLGYFSNRLDYGKNTFTWLCDCHGLEGDVVYSIIEDIKGNLLVGTYGKGVFQFRDGTFSRYKIKGLKEHIHKIYKIYEDRKRTLWITTTKGLFRVRRGTDGKDDITIFTTRHGLANDLTIDVIEDRDGNIWVGTVKGLNRLKQESSGKVVIDTLLEGHSASSLFEDREGSLWVGTGASGLKRLKDPGFIPPAAVDIKPGEIMNALFEDRQGNTWMGSLSGKLYRYGKGIANGKLSESPEVTEISEVSISAIEEDGSGNLWLGTYGEGVFQKRGEKIIHFTTRDGLADDRVFSIYTDSRNNTWFGTYTGVSRFSGGIFESLGYRDGLPSGFVSNVCEDKNQNIWLATQKGLCLLKNGRFSADHITVYLEGVPVRYIYEEIIPSGPGSPGEKSVFWIGTDGAGLKRFKEGTFTSYTTDEGIASDFIYHILEDKRGNLWMNSRTGVFRVNKYELTKFGKVHSTSFGRFDGMKSIMFYNRLSRDAAIKTRQGELWFVTKDGIFILNPDKIRITPSPPPVVIEEVLFDDRPVLSALHRRENVFKGIKEVVFHFTSPTFLSPKDVRFKYRLEGQNSDWVFLQRGEKRMARYNNLAPGDYVFRVTACNSDGVWKRTGASTAFTLKPFFYQTFLFKTAAFLLFLALALTGYFLLKKRPWTKRKKYKRSLMNPIFTKECIKKLDYLMNIEKVYRDETLSLQALAQKISISPHQLSQLLNEKLNKNFSEFINFYRVREAKKLLQNRNNGNRKILAIAFDVGFNTKSAFNNAFKKHTRMTASEYRKRGKR